MNEINEYEEAYLCARFTAEADIDRCQEIACKDPKYAYLFALEVPGADIDKCQKAVCKDRFWAHLFAREVKNADLSKIKELCPEISDKIDELVMNRVLV